MNRQFVLSAISIMDKEKHWPSAIFSSLDRLDSYFETLYEHSKKYDYDIKDFDYYITAVVVLDE